MKVAICFFGLTRSLKWNIESIKECIFSPLENAKINFDIFMHTYILKEENKTLLDNEEYKLLQPTKIIREVQDEINFHFEDYRSKGDPWMSWNNNFASLDNLIRQLHSLEQVTTLWNLAKQDSAKPNYDFVIYCRPDVKYVTQLDVSQLLKMKENEISIPDFHWHGGLNDRFAYGKPEVMKIYGNRNKQALEYSKNKKLHSETFLKEILKGVKIVKNGVHFCRVRANGNIVNENFQV